MAESRAAGWIGFRLLGAILEAKGLAAEVLAVGTTLLITAEVVSRYVFLQPLGWSVEVSEWVLLAITFLGAGLVLRRDGHVRVDLLLNALGARPRAVVEVAGAAVALAVSVAACYYTARTTYQEYATGVMTIQLLRFPRFWLLAFIPVGFLFLALEWLRCVVLGIEGLRGRPAGGGRA